MKKYTRHYFKTILALSLLAIASTSQAGWIVPAPYPWNNRKPITVVNNSVSAMQNYQVFISLKDLGASVLISKGAMNADYSDIRFTDSDGVTVLDHWVDTVLAKGVYVKVNANASSSKTIYMYYNSPAAANASSFLNTMSISPDSSTVGLWHFNETTGTLVSDASGHGNNGTLTATGCFWQTPDCPRIGDNTVTISTGSVLSLSNNFVFGGVSCGDTVIFQNLTSAITIEAWVKIKSLISGLSQKGYIACKQRGGIAGPYYLRLMMDPSSINVFQAGVNVNNADVNTYGVTAPQINTWYHVAMTYDSSTKMLKLYLNGSQDGSGTNVTATDASMTGTIHTGTTEWPFRIGTQDLPSSSEKFDGLIDEVAVYNRALSAEEIKAHYNRKSYLSPAPAVSIGTEELIVGLTFTLDPEILKPGLATFTYNFSSDMDTGTIPAVTFTPYSGAVVPIPGNWLSFRQYQCVYTVTSAIADGHGTVTLNGARLANGDLVGDFRSVAFKDSKSILPVKQFFPNPFSPNGDGFVDFTELPLFADSATKVKIKIFDLKGRLVRYLANTEISVNTTIRWDGKNDLGEIVPIGIYIYQLEMGGTLTSGSVVVTK